MRIAIGNSRMDKKWKNKEMSWEEFSKTCSTTIRTTETVSEYRKMSKPAQDNAKDVGGFCRWRLKAGKGDNAGSKSDRKECILKKIEQILSDLLTF